MGKPHENNIQMVDFPHMFLGSRAQETWTISFVALWREFLTPLRILVLQSYHLVEVWHQRCQPNLFRVAVFWLVAAGLSVHLAKWVTRHVKRCSGYDIFVSHDWQTSRWLKYLSLLQSSCSGYTGCESRTRFAGCLSGLAKLQLGNIHWLLYICCILPLLATHSGHFLGTKAGFRRQVVHPTAQWRSQGEVHPWPCRLFEAL